MIDFPLIQTLLIAVMFFVVALIYSSVGHAGASGYSAVLALFYATPGVLRPIALLLNVVVGGFGVFKFNGAGFIQARKIIPFLLTSMPMSYFAAQLKVDKSVFNLVLGLLLLVSAYKLLFTQNRKMNSEDALAIETKATDASPNKEINFLHASFWGALIGFLSGITGTGGAIFLTPLLLFNGWAKPKDASGLSICFVLCNSVMGLAGTPNIRPIFVSHHIMIWIFAVTLGALIGSHLGIKKFSDTRVLKVLGAVLLLGSLKLLANVIK